MKTVQWYITTMAINAALAAVIKSLIRARPESHARYVEFMLEQAKHEADRFRRLHVVDEEEADEPAGSDVGSN